jgi:hypothetical protein
MTVVRGIPIANLGKRSMESTIGAGYEQAGIYFRAEVNI